MCIRDRAWLMITSPVMPPTFSVTWMALTVILVSTPGVLVTICSLSTTVPIDPRLSVVLGGGHREPVRPDDRLGEARDAVRRGRGRVRGPQLRPEAHHEVDPGHRGVHRRDLSGGGDQRGRVDALAPVELQVGVRQGAEREDAGLRVGHGA